MIKDEWNIIAVYGTLKRGTGNYRVMEMANGVFLKEAYVSMDKIEWRGFPVAKFKEGTNKLLKVELFTVNKLWVEWPLDRLEWYPTHYTRKIVKTEEWDDVIIYEIARDITDDSERFATHKDEDKQYYEWF